VKQFEEDYGYDLKKELAGYPIKNRTMSQRRCEAGHFGLAALLLVRDLKINRINVLERIDISNRDGC